MQWPESLDDGGRQLVHLGRNPGMEFRKEQCMCTKRVRMNHPDDDGDLDKVVERKPTGQDGVEHVLTDKQAHREYNPCAQADDNLCVAGSVPLQGAKVIVREVATGYRMAV